MHTMRVYRRFALVGTLTLLGLTVACGDIKALLALQQDLMREFQTSSVKVSLGSSRLTVVFVNSPNADLPESDRAIFARRVAEFVRDHYGAFDQLQSLRVGFETVHGVGGFSVSSSRIPYEFTPSDLGSRKKSEPPGPRVLVIMISRTDHHNVWLAVGRAEESDSMVHIVLDDSGAAPITLRTVDERENGFPPEMLERVAAADQWALAQRLSQAVVRCIPILVDDEPRNVTAAPGFLDPTMTVQGERILLMAH